MRHFMSDRMKKIALGVALMVVSALAAVGPAVLESLLVAYQPLAI